MTSIILIFLISGALSFVLTFLLIKTAPLLGLLDVPDERKIHSTPTPHLGGIPIFLGFFTPLLALTYLYSDPANTHHMMLANKNTDLNILLLGALLILITGVIDDIKPMRPRYKVLGQVVAASVVFFMGFSIDHIALPIVGKIFLGPLDYPMTLLWFLGCMNVVNLIDGLDGLAAGICLLVGLIFLVVTLIFGQSLGTLYLATFCGCIFGFLWFNFFPAKIFLGDSGSMLLGYLIAHLAILETVPKTETTLALLVATVAMGLPIFDTLLAILRRWVKRMPIQNPDRSHIHHALLKMGYSHRRAVLTLYGACVALGVAALLITLQRNEITALVFLILTGVAVVFIKLFSGLSLQDFASQVINRNADREKEKRIRTRTHSLLNLLEECRNIEELTSQLPACLEALGCQNASIELRPEGKDPVHVNWSREVTTEAPDQDSYLANMEFTVDTASIGSGAFNFVSTENGTPHGLLLLQEFRHRLESTLSVMQSGTLTPTDSPRTPSE